MLDVCEVVRELEVGAHRRAKKSTTTTTTTTGLLTAKVP